MDGFGKLEFLQHALTDVIIERDALKKELADARRFYVGWHSPEEFAEYFKSPDDAAAALGTVTQLRIELAAEKGRREQAERTLSAETTHHASTCEDLYRAEQSAAELREALDAIAVLTQNDANPRICNFALRTLASHPAPSKEVL